MVRLPPAGDGIFPPTTWRSSARRSRRSVPRGRRWRSRAGTKPMPTTSGRRSSRCRSSTGPSPWSSRRRTRGSTGCPTMPPRGRVWSAFLDVLADIHRVDADGLGLRAGLTGELSSGGTATSAGPRTVRRHPPGGGDGWCRANRPAASHPPRCCGGRAVRQRRVRSRPPAPRAVLDWDMASVGPAEMDVAWFLALDQLASELSGVSVGGFGTRDETISAPRARLGRRCATSTGTRCWPSCGRGGLGPDRDPVRASRSTRHVQARRGPVAVGGARADRSRLLSHGYRQDPMAHREFGPWVPLESRRVVETFAPASFPEVDDRRECARSAASGVAGENVEHHARSSTRDRDRSPRAPAGWDLQWRLASSHDGGVTPPSWSQEPHAQPSWSRRRGWSHGLTCHERGQTSTGLPPDPRCRSSWHLAVLHPCRGRPVPGAAPSCSALQDKNLRAKHESTWRRSTPCGRSTTRAPLRDGPRPPMAAPPHPGGGRRRRRGG